MENQVVDKLIIETKIPVKVKVYGLLCDSNINDLENHIA